MPPIITTNFSALGHLYNVVGDIVSSSSSYLLTADFSTAASSAGLVSTSTLDNYLQSGALDGYALSGADPAYVLSTNFDPVTNASSLSTLALAVAAVSPPAYQQVTNSSDFETLIGSLQLSYTDNPYIYLYNDPAPTTASFLSGNPLFVEPPTDTTSPLSYAVVNQSGSVSTISFLYGSTTDLDTPSTYSVVMEIGEGFSFVYTPSLGSWTTLPGLYPMNTLRTVAPYTPPAPPP